MMGSTRTIITISDDEKRWLKSYSQMHRISLAEAVRKGIFLPEISGRGKDV